MPFVLQQVNTWRPELIELEDRAKQVLCQTAVSQLLRKVFLLITVRICGAAQVDVCVDCGSINTVYLGFKGELKVVLISIPGV